MAREQRILSDCLADYLRWRQTAMAASTSTGDKQVLTRFVSDVGDRQMRHLTAEVATGWLAGLTTSHLTRDGLVREPVQPSTFNYYLRRLRAFLLFCQRRGWLREDPLLEVRPKRQPRKRRQQPPPAVLLQMLDAAANARDRGWIATTINTALRASEIKRLRVGDVDLLGGWLSVQLSKSPEDTLFPISADLDAELRRWLTQYESDLGRPPGEEDHLFPALAPGVYTGETVRGKGGVYTRGRTAWRWRPDRQVTHSESIVQHALMALGLPTRYEGTHTVRRAVARAFFDSMVGETGYDAALRTTSALLHHKNSQTTETYLGLDSERKRRDEMLRGRPFLTAMVSRDNVTPLRRTSEG